MDNPEVFEQTLVVQSEHLDEMIHVNNVQYLQWVQDIAKAHWENRAKAEWLEKYAWVALSHHIEYKKPTVQGDEILLQTHVKEFTGVKSHRLVRIRNAKTGDLLTQASTVWCMLDRVTMRPTRVVKEMSEYFNLRQ